MLRFIVLRFIVLRFTALVGILAGMPLFGQAPVSIGDFRASTGQFILDLNHTFNPAQSTTFNFVGYVSGDRTIVGDWNGDGRSKYGIYRSGTFYLDYNGNGSWDGPAIDRQYTFTGYAAGDIPVLGDWTGDKKTKIGVYRDGLWYLDLNGNGVWDGNSVDRSSAFGGSHTTYIPVVGDWNGDGRAKIGYFKSGTWLLDYNGNGTWDGASVDRQYAFGGTAGDQPVTGDWSGNGKSKIGTYNKGFWSLDLNGNGSWEGSTVDQFTAFGGNTGEIPVTGDWNGDGRTKVGVFFGAGTWWLDANGNGKWDGAAVDFSSIYGQTGDTPVTGKWAVGGPSLPNSLNINNTGLSTGHAGAGAQTFTFNYRDISGAANIQSGQVEFIDGTPAGNPRCRFQWQRPNILNIYATGASTSTLGTAISDGFCSVALISIVNSPTDPYAVAVTASITFLQDYPGLYGTQTYGVLTQVNDVSGFRTSWGQVGTWTVDQVPIGPFSGTGATQTFTLSAADPNGQSYTNINNVQLIFNWAPYQSDACYLNYDAVNDLLFLADVTGNFSVFSPISLKNPGGTLGDLVTSNCQVVGSASTITGSGASLYLNLKLNFKSTFIGQQNTFVAVSDTLANSPPVQVGTWTAYPAPTGSGPTSILPSGVNNDGTGTITFTYDDPNGFNYVPGMHIQIGQTFDDPGNCRLVYLRGTGQTNHAVWVYYDTWSAYVGAGYVGQPGVTISSPNRCTVDLGASTFGENGTRGALNLAVNLQNANASGKVTVWMRPFDRQSVVSPNWAANPSPAFPIATDDFSLGPVSSVTAQQTQTQGFTVPVGVFGKFAGTVTFTCAAPGSVTIACSGPVSTSGTAPYTAAFSVTPSAAASGGNIAITATSGALSHRITIPLNVTASPLPPDITFSGSQIIQVGPNGSATFSLSVTPINGWTAPVTLHTFNALVGFDFCPLVNGSCTGNAIAGNDVILTTLPATVYFRVTDRTGAPGQAVFAPSVTSTTPARSTGVSFTMQVVGGTPPAGFTLSAPTQITVPVGGTAPASVSVTQQGGYTGTVAVTASSGIASFAPNQLTLGAGAPTAQTTAIFAAGSRGPGVYTETILAGGKIQAVQVTVAGATPNSGTVPSSTISLTGTTPSVLNDSTPTSYELPFSYGDPNYLYPTCSVPLPQRDFVTITRDAPTVKGCAPDNNIACKIPFKASAQSSVPAGTYNITCKYDDSTRNGPRATGTTCPNSSTVLCISAGSLIVRDATPVITSVTPSTIYSGSTNTISVSGHNFGSHPTVNINGINYPSSGTISIASSQTVAVAYTDPGSPAGTLIPVYLTSNGDNSLAFQGTGGTSSISNTKNIVVRQPSCTPSVSIAALSGGQKLFWQLQDVDSDFRRFYTSGVRATGSPSGGSFSWTFDNGNLLKWTDTTGIDASGSNSGSTDANGTNSVHIGIQELSDVNRHPTLGRTGTITVTYQTPCGVATDTVTVVLTETIQVFAYVDGVKIDDDSRDPQSTSFLDRARFDADPVTFLDYAQLHDPIIGLGNAVGCVSNILGWRDLGNGSSQAVDYISITTDAGRRYANYFLTVETANTAGSPPNLAPSYADPMRIAQSPSYYRAYNQLQVAFQVVNSRMTNVQYLQHISLAGTSLEPCTGFRVDQFSPVGVTDSGDNGKTGTATDSIGDFAYQINQARVGADGESVNAYLNWRADLQSLSPDITGSASTPYIWSVVAFGVDGTPRPISPGDITNFDQATLAWMAPFSTFELFKGPNFVRTFGQTSLESFIAQSSQFRFRGLK